VVHPDKDPRPGATSSNKSNNLELCNNNSKIAAAVADVQAVVVHRVAVVPGAEVVPAVVDHTKTYLLN